MMADRFAIVDDGKLVKGFNANFLEGRDFNSLVEELKDYFVGKENYIFRNLSSSGCQCDVLINRKWLESLLPYGTNLKYPDPLPEELIKFADDLWDYLGASNHRIPPLGARDSYVGISGYAPAMTPLRLFTPNDSYTLKADFEYPMENGYIIVRAAWTD